MVVAIIYYKWKNGQLHFFLERETERRLLGKGNNIWYIWYILILVILPKGACKLNINKVLWKKAWFMFNDYYSKQKRGLFMPAPSGEI